VLRDNNIEWEKSYAYAHHQQGLVERLNRTITAIIRTLLLDTNIPSALWTELAHTAVYLRNRSPTRALKDKTPYEAYWGEKPNIEHLRAIGSIVYARNVEIQLEDPRKKLDPKARKVRLIGYRKGSDQYKVWNPITNKVEEVTFVRIDENDTQMSAEERLIELDQPNTEDPEYSNDSSSSSSSESETPTQPKRGRGRPRKLPLKPITQAKRKRGRPRKIPLYVEIGTNIATYQLAPYPETNIAAYASTPNHDKSEPTTYEAAIHGPEGDQWKQAIKEEYDSIIENDT
jgi:hypothetical protein